MDRTSRWTSWLALACAAAALVSPAAAQTLSPSDVTAEIRIVDATTPHNSYPDACDQRLSRLYIAQGLELAVEVTFSRALSDAEREQIHWEVTGDAASPASGDFVGQGNPARVTTTVAAATSADPDQVVVRVTHQGADIAAPAPLRIVSNDEYATARAALAGVTAVSGRPRSQLPLTVDLLARFLGQESGAVGVPSIGVYALSICDARLTHRAGADWGSGTVADVPLLVYGADQPASSIVAEAVAREVLSQNAEQIGAFFLDNPEAQTVDVAYTVSRGLTLNRPLDALLALHGVQFDGTLSATIDAPTGPRALLTARGVRVSGTAGDLYDFNLEDTGAGAIAAGEAAKVQIGSAAHDLGKIFVVSFQLNESIDALEF